MTTSKHCHHSYNIFDVKSFLKNFTKDKLSQINIVNLNWLKDTLHPNVLSHCQKYPKRTVWYIQGPTKIFGGPLYIYRTCFVNDVEAASTKLHT